MNRRINRKRKSDAGVGPSDFSLSGDRKNEILQNRQKTREGRYERSLSPVFKVKTQYCLRSCPRQTSSSVRSRYAKRPLTFMSQARERYFSDADDDDSIPFADDESEKEGSDFLPEDDGESNELDSDEIHRHIARPQMPEFKDDIDIPALILPETSFDLLIDPEFSLQAVSIYQVLRQFSRILHLSLFRFEDFCASLTVNEQSCLLAETHIALLKCILQEEDCTNSMFGPNDAKDSINISLYVIDGVTWFEVVRLYLESLTIADDDFQQVLTLFHGNHYQDLNTSQRLLLLQTLTDLFLATNLVRETIMKEGAFTHEEQCRCCHRRGDLICCETCPAVFHLECLKPPLTAVPDDDWFCCVCSALQVKGINECSSDMKKDSLLCRLEPLGYDRHQQKYWFLCRRVFVEGDGRTWYYSTPAQLEELILALDEERWEVDLVSALKANKSLIAEQMAITEELTNKVKGRRKSALAAHDEILKDLHLKRESLKTVNDEDSLKQRVEYPEEDKKPNNILTQDHVTANLDKDFGISELLQSEETKGEKVENGDETCDDSIKVENGEETCDDSEVNNSKTPHDGDINGGCDLMLLKNDEAAAADMNYSGEESQQNVKAKSDENDGNETALSPQELHSVAESLPSAEDVKLSSDAAVERPSSVTSDSISEVRQTRSKSRHLYGVALFEADKQTNCEQHFVQYPTLFKLGMEGNYKTYFNLYSTNPLALSKQQQNDEREKRRHLSYKFSLTPLSEFVWIGVIYGLSRQTVDAVKRSLFNLEESIDRCFLHPNWCQNSGRWQKAVSLCSTAADFGLAFMILEACIKPFLFNSIWHESLGHVKLRRTTAAEKEERKKKAKELKRIRYEDDCVPSTWVKYSLGLHHQVWKQKGEEYRSTGKGGWFWVSSTRVGHPSILKQCGFLRMFRKNCQSHKTVLSSEKDKSTSQESDSESIQPAAGNRTDKDESIVSNDMSQVEERTEVESGAVKFNELETLEQQGLLGKTAGGKFLDGFDVSEALLSRSFYKKQSTTHCFLDRLLEMRTGQLQLELEQKAAVELALRQFHAEVALAECSQPKCSSSCPDSNTGLCSGDSRSLVSPESNKYMAKLNFAKRNVDDSENSREKNEEEVEENSDNEVTLEKEDLEDSSSVDSCQVEEVIMSEDSNISNASSVAANIIPPPVQSRLFGRALMEPNRCSVKAFKEDSVSEQRPSASAAAAGATQIEISCSHNVINSLENYVKDGNILLTKDIAKEIEEKLKEVGKTQFQVKLQKHINSVTGKKKRKQIKKGNIPRAQNFLTKNNKRSLFVLEKDELAILARKGGQKEAYGFNYACKMNDVSWPYPCPRPYFKTAWRYRTQTAKNISAIALQLRILWANIRWDDMAIKCMAGKNTTVSETEVTTIELLKRRDIGPTNLRAEYLIQKTILPLDIPVPSKERSLPPQRSGLRERRQQETPISREPVISEFWVPEEQLELWQVKLFAERLEKKQHKQKEKASEKKSKTVTPCGKSQESNGSIARTSSLKSLEKKLVSEPIIKVGSAAVEEELQQQRTLMRQRRLGLSLLRGQSDDQINRSSSISTGELSMPAAPMSSASQNNMPRSLKLPFRRLGVPKTNINKAVSRSADMTFPVPVVACPVSASQSIRLPGSVSQKLTLATAVVACSPTLTPVPSSPATSSAVQSIRIRKGPDGQLQITGLQPGQEIIRLPDGRLRLVAKPLPDQPSATPVDALSYSSSTTVPLNVTSSAQSDSSLEGIRKTAKDNNLQSEDSTSHPETDLQVQHKLQNLEENDQGRPEQMLPSADKQTKATVVTAVEKLFACLSPLRLQNKRKSSEKAVCDRQLPSEEVAKNHCTDDHAVADAVAENIHVSNVCNMLVSDPFVLSSTGSFSQAERNCLSLPTDKQKDLSDNRTDEFQNQFLTAKVLGDAVGHPATLSDQSDFLGRHESSAQKEEMCSVAASAQSFLVMPSSLKADLTGEGISKRCKRTSETEHSTSIPRVSGTAGPMTECSDEASGCRKRKRERPVQTAARLELAEASRMKGAGCRSTIVEEIEDNQSTFKRSKTNSDKIVSDKQLMDQVMHEKCKQQLMDQVMHEKCKQQLMDQVMHEKCKQKLSGAGVSTSEGEPLKKDQCKTMQATGGKRGTLEAHRQRMEAHMKYDEGEPSVLPIEATKKHSKKIYASRGSRMGCTVKQDLGQLSTDEKQKLFCICRTHYDPSRFYVGCDVCLNWFHGSCVNISEEDVHVIGSYVCSACRQQSSSEREKVELFCMCHQPYDESLFYIGCNDCGGWFHGSCVDVSPSDVGRMDCYLCPTCHIKRGCSRVELQEEHFPIMKKLISTLKLNSLAKPICKLTNTAEKQSYSEVVKKPIDFSAVEKKIESRTYLQLEDFVTDVLKIFSNCRTCNSRVSPIFSSAISVEKEFLSKFEKLKTEIFQL